MTRDKPRPSPRDDSLQIQTAFKGIDDAVRALAILTDTATASGYLMLHVHRLTPPPLGGTPAPGLHEISDGAKQHLELEKCHPNDVNEAPGACRACYGTGLRGERESCSLCDGSGEA